jgi:hypothetical protein
MSAENSTRGSRQRVIAGWERWSSGLADLLDTDEDARICREIPEQACREQPRNRLVHIAALTLTKMGDSLVDAKLTLTWLLGALGAPSFMIAWLVPVRESLALLPQLAVGQWIREHPVRKGFWITGSIVQAAALLAMALVAALLDGALAGWCIIAALAVFALGRGVTSVASKDVLGKTVDKQRRGVVSGVATSISGFAAIVLGSLLIWFGAPEGRAPLVVLLCVAASLWLVACVVYATLREFPGATEGGENGLTAALANLRLAWEDAQLRSFLVTRTLLIGSGLAAPFYVSLANQNGQQALRQLGALVLVAGVANLLSGRLWGGLADRSSRWTMALGGGLCAALSLAVVGAEGFKLPFTQNASWYALVIFLFYLGHAGIRLGRKTYLVDMATPENRAQLVAVSNTLIGVLLLVIGGLSSWLSIWGTLPALVGLAALCAAGAMMALALPPVTAD